MKLPWLMIAALLGGLAVVMGAAGAHLAGADDTLESFYKTAFTYHMFHVMPLIAVSFLIRNTGPTGLFANIAGYLFLAGIILFSGSLYYLGFAGEPVGFFITPSGGMALIAGWLSLAISGYFDWRKRSA